MLHRTVLRAGCFARSPRLGRTNLDESITLTEAIGRCGGTIQHVRAGIQRGDIWENEDGMFVFRKALSSRSSGTKKTDTANTSTTATEEDRTLLVSCLFR